MGKTREEIAVELAAKDGRPWPPTEPNLEAAYLHNADVIIEQQKPVMPIEAPGVEGLCFYCKGEAWVNGKPCPECNPVGLPKEKVYPKWAQAIVDEKAKKEAKTKAAEMRATKPIKLNKGQFWCSKCNAPHYSAKAAGIKHSKYQIEVPIRPAPEEPPLEKEA